jgi:hypothetical protein
MKNPIILLLLAFVALQGWSQSALPTPSLLQVEKNQADAGIILRWDAPPVNILGYVIEKKEAGGPWMIVFQAEPGEKSFIDRNCSSAASSYRIRSFANAVLSEYSNVKDYKALTGRTQKL